MQALSLSLAGWTTRASANNAPSTPYMPDESHPHRQTWTAFVASDDIWSRRQIPEVKRNLALIANTIAKYEPVSVLVNPRDYDEAVRLLDSGSAHPITLLPCEIDDLWLRDTGPTFVTNQSGDKMAVDFNFNGWGNKQAHSKDARVAQFIANASQATLINTDLVLEGGCFEVDGNGTAIMTKSCIINDNRNPHLTPDDIEAELKALLGLQKIIWLEGIKGRDITDGHTDFYARFSKPGHVLVSRDNDPDSYDYAVTRKNLRVLENSRDANGNKLHLTVMDSPQLINTRFGSQDFAAGYIGYYVCNGAVIAQKFGDAEADAQAKQILQRAFPDRVVEQISIDGIAAGGGSIHCATQQQPRTIE